MATKGNIHTRAIAVLVVGYIVGLIAYPNLPGPLLDEEISARIMVAFTLPTTALVMIELTGAMDAVGFHLSPGRAVVVLLGVVLVAIGNLLPRTRPNVAVGVRTRRTLTNAQLWQQVHRAGGYATVGLGIVIAVTGLVLSHEAVGAVISAAALFAAVTVFVSYRKYVRAGITAAGRAKPA